MFLIIIITQLLRQRRQEYILVILVLKILAADAIRPYKINVKVGPTSWHLLLFTIVQYQFYH